MSNRVCFLFLMITSISLASCGQDRDQSPNELKRPIVKTMDTRGTEAHNKKVKAPLKAPEESQPIEFVRIEGGGFKMGGDSKGIVKPILNVTVPTFEISRTEVTIGQYRVCVNAGRCGELPWRNKKPGLRENHPITNISWHEAKSFAEYSGARLPTSAEWEFAATSRGKSGVYVWGDETPDCKRLNFKNCAQDEKRVCSYRNSNTTQGLCDMAGNVAEWVEDDWTRRQKGAPIDGSAHVQSPRPKQRVVRGGSFLDDDYLIEPRSRMPQFATSKHSMLGFRLARSINK